MANTPKPASLPRAAYADMFGPTVGDRIRLADTALEITVERDFTTYGEEVKFGGGKVIRDGMGQSQVTNRDGAVDTVITNAVVLDHWGIVKCDVGIVQGRIQKLGKAGNPDVHGRCRPRHGRRRHGTEVIAGEGLILTAGGIDSPHPLTSARSKPTRRRCRRRYYHHGRRRHGAGHTAPAPPPARPRRMAPRA